MRNKTAAALALAFVASLMTVAPVAAWYVDSGDCESAPAAKSIDPRGDPYARIVVRNDRTDCRGWVRVPDKDWVRGGTFFVTGTDIAIGRGERAWLPPGEYRGTWSNTSEHEHFTIRDLAGPVVVGWAGVRRDGRSVRVYTVPRGCTFRSGWHWFKGGTLMSVQDRTHKTRLLTKRMAPAGFYSPLWHGYARGLTCDGFGIA